MIFFYVVDAYESLLAFNVDYLLSLGKVVLHHMSPSDLWTSIGLIHEVLISNLHIVNTPP
jgi:hypothetical protein